MLRFRIFDRLATAIALTFVHAFPVLAVEIEPGVVYEGGTRLEASDLGVAFSVPAGWQAALPAGGNSLLMQPVGDPGVYILAMGEPATRSEMKAQMEAPIDLGDGVYLQPKGQTTVRGAALAAHYDVSGTVNPLRGYGEALVSDHGMTVAFLLVAAPEKLTALEPVVHALADGTTLEASGDPATGSGGSAGGDRWDEYLKGKYIVRYYTSTGYTDEQHLWLCSDGRFARRGASGGFGGGASGAFQADSSGQWTATGAGENGVLTLQYGDGSVAQHELFWDYGENKLYVDGKRWLHDKNELCQ